MNLEKSLEKVQTLIWTMVNCLSLVFVFTLQSRYPNMWHRIIGFGKPDNRPHWEVMADDGMNKFLKFCISCVFLWMGYQVVIALIDRFF